MTPPTPTGQSPQTPKVSDERVRELIAIGEENIRHDGDKAWLDMERDAVAALRELLEVRADRKDAERYRWLRGPDSTIDSISKRTRISNQGATAITLLEAAELDAAIDAAIAATQAGREG